MSIQKIKILIIRTTEESSWGSCRVISPNLQKTYQHLSKEIFEIRFFDITEKFLLEDLKTNSNHMRNLANMIIQFEPDELVFVDHLPHPFKILSVLQMFLTKSQFPTLVFHIYGDFSYFASDWIKFALNFPEQKVKFIVASESQLKLLNYFSKNSNCNSRFLFPVNSNDYFFNSDERTELRKKMNLAEDDFVILYSGRISLQKNVDLIIDEFSNLNDLSPGKVHLWIVGSFDDLGANFMGVNNLPGYMFHKIQEILDLLPPHLREKITFWGNQKKEMLRKINNASDLFISLSLYHDEDFGMSPAEALATGLPTLLTDWGGYSSFMSKEWCSDLVPVNITPFGLEISAFKMVEFIENTLKAKVDFSKRKLWSDKFLKEFSIEGSSWKLAEILKNETSTFDGFSFGLKFYQKEFGHSLWKLGKEISEELTPSSENYYYQVYQNYISLNGRVNE